MPPEGGVTTLPLEVARLRTLRRRRGWTQAQLAEAAGVGVATITRLEAAGVAPRPSTLARIAAALGVRIPDVDEFGDDELPRVADQRVRYDPHGRGR